MNHGNGAVEHELGAMNENFFISLGFYDNGVTSAESNDIATAQLLHKCSYLKLHSSARVGNGKSRARSCTVILQLHALTRSGPPH